MALARRNRRFYRSVAANSIWVIRGDGSALTTAYAAIASPPVGCRSRKQWANNGHSTQWDDTGLSVVAACRPNLRRTHRLGHAEEDHNALAAAPRRERLVAVSVATVDVLPVVHHPDVA